MKAFEGKAWTKFIAVIAKIVTVALKVPPNAWYPCFRLKETRRNNLYCALDTKGVKTLTRNNYEKKRLQPLRNSKS